MRKFAIILSSILFAIVAIIATLFGAVFRLRSQTVDFVGENSYEISSNSIVKAGKLKVGSSIFMLDKQKAQTKIENAFAYLKVIQIKTTSVVSVEIRVRQRYKTFYAEFENNFYVLDEELKVLEILETRPENLIEIKDELNLTTNTKVCDFVGTKTQQNITYNLIVSMITTVKKDILDGGEYLNRVDIVNYIDEIKFETGYTTNQKYTRLIIKTNYGVSIDIAKPQKELSRKINMCFACLNSLTSEKRASGTIKLSIDNSGTEVIGYIQ